MFWTMRGKIDNRDRGKTAGTISSNKIGTISCKKMWMIISEKQIGTTYMWKDDRDHKL